VIWACYAAGLGFVFGATFEDDHTLAFIFAFGAALAITVVIELIRHARNRGKDADDDEPAVPERVGS
jgi:membrane-associated protein